MTAMLTITDLHVAAQSADGSTLIPVLKGLNLRVGTGEVHAVMGPNGSGKTTLGRALAGHPGYAVTKGSITYQGKDLTDLEPEVRARAGVFVSWQYPVEVPGVGNVEFLRLAFNAREKAAGRPEIAAKDFAAVVKAKAEAAQIPPEFLERQLNTGMSGGQKKRNEILQLHVLEPVLAVLDETDSGLDIDSFKAVAQAVNAYRRADRSIILITHFKRLLDLIQPDKVHVLMDGRIVTSGDASLAGKLEQLGYDWLVP